MIISGEYFAQKRHKPQPGIKSTVTGRPRRFLLLQGPHGPYFRQLGRMLVSAGADVWRVGFNAGDRAFWRPASHYVPFRDAPRHWPDFCRSLFVEKEITDIVLYGDTKPVHVQAIEIATDMGITVHVFEEGYLRPYWVTYERGGANGHSRLMNLSVQKMQEAVAQLDPEMPVAPGHWGHLRQHVFYGAIYHWWVMFANRGYRQFRSHRSISVSHEFQLYLKRLLLMPFHALDRVRATRRVKAGGYPYHLVLLQLEHDSSFRMHSDFATMADFLEVVIKGFATGAPKHHHLVFKAHPLEDGRVPIRRDLRRLARLHGISNRVHYVGGGKLARLLDHARSAVTVNSTAAQQVLWRGIPLKTFGAAVYDKPQFVSSQPLTGFFRQPSRPDRNAYRDYRLFLLETSQISGGFYASRGRRQLLRQVVDMMLAKDDPYAALENGTAAPRQQLVVVK